MSISLGLMYCDHDVVKDDISFGDCESELIIVSDFSFDHHGISQMASFIGFYSMGSAALENWRDWWLEMHEKN